MRTSIVLLLLVLAAGCAADGTLSPTSAPSAEPVLVIVEGDPGAGPGLSVDDALTHGPTDDIVSVTGALFVAADGAVNLCDAIAESFPPQCGGARLEVTGLDLDALHLEEANGVRWAESVTLLGSVE